VLYPDIAPIPFCLELMGYRCVYLPISLATIIFSIWDSTHCVLSCEFIVNLIGYARSDVFQGPSKFSLIGLCSLALASELITERQQNVVEIQGKH
jgi:hypothetical protein